jgi:hypothetical protein
MPDDSLDRMIADRNRQDLTPEQLSSSAGLPAGMVRQIERGWHTCEPGEVRRLEFALGLPAGILSYANVRTLSH